MTCKQVSVLVSAFVDGEVTAIESMGIRAHLHDCECCANAVRELKVVRSIMKIEPKDIPIPAGLEQRLVATVTRPPKQKFVLVASLATVALIASLMVPAMAKSSPVPNQNRNMAMKHELVRDHMSSFGSDPTEGACLTSYANCNNAIP
jgi:anti-sigma factor RsiW